MKKGVLLTLSLFLITPNLMSCGETSSQENVINVESVSLSSTSQSLKVGEQLQLVVSILPLNATNKNVTYSTSNDNVIVSSSGLVTAQKVGTVTIEVKTEDGNKTSSISLEVQDNDPNKNLSIGDYANKLSESPYANLDITSKEKYGLENNNVGVNQNVIVEKYGKINDDQVDEIIVVNDISLQQVQQYFSSCTELNNYYKLQTSFYLAKEKNDANKVVKIKLPTGKIDVEAYLSKDTSALSLDGLNGTYVEGDNSIINILIQNLNYKGYLTITNCENIYFNDMTFQAEIPSSLTGKIIEGNTETKTLKVEVDQEFNPLVKELLLNKKSLRSWVEFGQINKTPLEGGNFLVDSFKEYTISEQTNGNYQIEVTFSTGISRPRNGTLVALQFSQYDARGASISSSNNIYFENITMHNAYGMALVASSTSNLYLNRFNLSIKENSASLMTATADALHFEKMSGNVEVTNSIIENSHDDALNIKHGYWYKLVSAEGGSAKTMTVNKITGTVLEPKVGDKIAIYNEDTFEGHNPTNGYYTINSVEKTSAGYVFKVKERMSNVNSWGNCRVTFLSNTPKLTFTNNIIRNKRNRGLLIQVPDAVIENNAFMNVGHGSIQVASAMDQYNEATLAQNVTIKNNKFINNCYIKPEPLYGDISIFAISSNASVAPKSTLYGATIENNFISRNGNAALSFRGVGSSTISDNLFYDCSYTQPSGDKFNTLLQAVNCENIELKDNYNYYTLNKNLSGISPEGNTSESDINIDKSNYNISFKTNSEAGPKVEVSKLNKQITIDGDLSDWNDSNATNIDIIGISDAEGSQRTSDELANHFKLNKLVMSYDDNGIYFGFDVYDNKIDVRTINDFWLGDCVELFMSTITDMPNADMQVYKQEGGVLQAAFAPTWERNGYFTFSEVRTNSKYIENQALMQANFTTKSDGYVGEFMIPFTLAPEFKEAIDNNKTIDIAIVIADAERNDMGLKRVQMGNIPHFVEDYKTKTARMPQYLFK